MHMQHISVLSELLFLFLFPDFKVEDVNKTVGFGWMDGWMGFPLKV